MGCDSFFSTCLISSIEAKPSYSFGLVPQGAREQWRYLQYEVSMPTISHTVITMYAVTS